MLNLIVPAQIGIIDLSEIKAHLRLDHSYEDEYLLSITQAATTMVEQYLGRSLLSQVWQLLWQREADLVGLARITLPNPPLQEVISVSHLRPHHGKKAIKRYVVDYRGPLPVVECGQGYEVIEVIYKAVFGDYPKHIPAPIKQALLLFISDLYENRMNSSIQNHSLLETLLSPFRVVRLV